LQYLFGTFIALGLFGAPWGFAHFRHSQIRNFHIVRDGVLYRSGQMSISGLKRVIHDYGIKTVVTLRDAYYPGNLPPDLAEQHFCEAEELNYVRITPRTWWASDGSVPAEKGIRQFLEVMDDPANYPVLIHCFAGSHRTGAYCAVYRMEYERWTNAEALAEMKAFGYCNLDDELDILGYLEQYRPRWRLLTEPSEDAEPSNP
jgi:protein tyrosine/serine phosphatase